MIWPGRIAACRGAMLLAATSTMLLVLVGCGSGPTLSRSTADRDGWTWGLKVDSGSITCDKGISGPEIGFTPEGLSTTYALSSNAIADARARPTDTKFAYATLGDIWDGRSPFRPFLDAAWRGCGHNDGAPDYEAESVMGKAYQPR